jgi:hypothetical protein
MADYSKQTVANLRVILKDRGIPSTGLTRKQQIIERLEEDDQAATNEAPPTDAEADKADDAAEEDEGPEAAQAEDASKTPEEDAAPPADAPDASAPVEPAAAEEEVAGDEAGPKAESKEPPAGEPESGLSSAKNEPEPEPEKPEAQQEDTSAVPTISEPPPASTSPPTADRTPQHVTPSMAVSKDSSIDPAEALEDTRKRKRRSATPPVQSDDVARKKPRQQEVVQLPEDQSGEPEAKPEAKPEVKPDVPMADAEPEASPTEPEKPGAEPMETDAAESSPPSKPAQSPKSARQQKFPSLSNLTGPRPTKEDPAPEGGDEDERDTTPALHAATRSLYIRNLMRPLHPQPFKAHLLSLATGNNPDTQPTDPSAAADDDLLPTFHLSPLRTHALVTFATPAHAARARAALHGATWPPRERDRKPLWVDFAPDDAVARWAAVEAAAAARHPRALQRWEVVYNDDGAGGVVAVHQEVGAGASAQPQRSQPAAPAPAVPSRQPRGEAAPAPSREQTSKPFRALDELFRSTRAKPKLYFLPVADDVAEARLRALERMETGGSAGAEGTARYSFEGTTLVEIEDARGFGPGGGGGGGGRGDAGFGFRGRGRGWNRGRGLGYRGTAF